MKLAILLMACLVCSAFAWPNKRRKQQLRSYGETESKPELTEESDPCMEMARKCGPPPEEEGNTVRQLLRDAEETTEKLECLLYLEKEIADVKRKRSEPADEEAIMEEAEEIIKQCMCDENDEPAGGEGTDGELEPLSERLFRLLRGEQEEEGKEEKCSKALEAAGIELEGDESLASGENSEEGEGPEQSSESSGPEMRELLKLLQRLRK